MKSSHRHHTFNRFFVITVPPVVIGVFLAIAIIYALTNQPNANTARETSSTFETTLIPDNYIVVLKDDSNQHTSADVANEMAKKHGLRVRHAFGKALNGFAATIPAYALEDTKNDPRVAFVTQDRTVHIAGETVPTGVNRVGAPLNKLNKGTKVGVAVIDTGIDLTHRD